MHVYVCVCVCVCVIRLLNLSTEQALPDDWQYTGSHVPQVHSPTHNHTCQGNDGREHYVSVGLVLARAYRVL